MLTKSLKKYRIILGSASPRRKFLMEELGLKFTIQNPVVEEIYPQGMPVDEIAGYLAEIKAEAVFRHQGSPDDTIIIAADTIVVLNGKVIGKPENEEDAIHILGQLSGHKHIVISGVCFKAKNLTHSFSERTEVFFRQLKTEEISHYIDMCKPLDKAGAYGIQEWIGLTGVTRINGCFFNVMGLPVPRLYQEVILFAERMSG